jgi:hypothetical protein
MNWKSSIFKIKADICSFDIVDVDNFIQISYHINNGVCMQFMLLTSNRGCGPGSNGVYGNILPRQHSSSFSSGCRTMPTVKNDLAADTDHTFQPRVHRFAATELMETMCPEGVDQSRNSCVPEG